MNTMPLANDLWEGIAGHFDSICQVLCEFVDNSISNFHNSRHPHKTVNISIKELPREQVTITVEDTGSGIANFEPVLRLGDRTVGETPLNEHGFGLKHALASANPANDCWKIFTRTPQDFEENRYRIVQAPFSFQMDENFVQIKNAPWPGLHNGSGTIVEFQCTKVFFDTIQRGIGGRASFARCLDYLREDLGYIYAGLIEKGEVMIHLSSQNVDYSKSVEAIKPDWLGYYDPKTGTTDLDLGSGNLTIEYQFGEMGESDYIKHYKRNMSTSGAEIRINGRIVMSNIFKEIWEIEPHPSYNHFLVIINLVADSLEVLPKTRTSKNGIRNGDDKLEALYSWVRKTHPTPPKDLAGSVSEKELLVELEKLKQNHIRDETKHIEREFKVFTKFDSPVSVDLYVYDGNDVVLYEAKKDTADPQNVYQLLMYWDGAVADGISPTEGILIASNFSSGIGQLLDIINQRQDNDGKNYNFSMKTWREESVDYPKP